MEFGRLQLRVTLTLTELSAGWGLTLSFPCEALVLTRFSARGYGFLGFPMFEIESNKSAGNCCTTADPTIWPSDAALSTGMAAA